MNSFFGISSGSSNMFDSFFGSATSGSSTSGMYSLGDMKMIQSGAYKKALKAYYAIQDSDDSEKNNTILNSGKSDSNNSLSLVKSSAETLKKTSAELKATDFSTADEKDITSKVKSFVDSYNETLTSTKSLNSYSILQTEVWATKEIKANAGLLSDVGITIGEENKLSIDEEKLKKADKSVLKTLFSGANSIAAKMEKKASALMNLSANQLAVNSGKTTYNANGVFR